MRKWESKLIAALFIGAVAFSIFALMVGLDKTGYTNEPLETKEEEEVQTTNAEPLSYYLSK